MTEAELEDFVTQLRRSTHLARLGHNEAVLLVAKIIEALTGSKTGS